MNGLGVAVQGFMVYSVYQIESSSKPYINSIKLVLIMFNMSCHIFAV